MTRVRFTSEVRLDWPASTTWYLFLKALHQRLAGAERMCYDDKDIMLPVELRFENGDNGYQELVGLDVRFVRFNERGNEATHYHTIRAAQNPPAGKTYRINLEMFGGTVTAFDYERMS